MLSRERAISVLSKDIIMYSDGTNRQQMIDGHSKTIDDKRKDIQEINYKIKAKKEDTTVRKFIDIMNPELQKGATRNVYDYNGWKYKFEYTGEVPIANYKLYPGHGTFDEPNFEQEFPNISVSL